LPNFEWKLFEKEKKLGCGTFRSVYLGKYKENQKKWLPKRIMSSGIPSERSRTQLNKYERPQEHNLVSLIL
jgi:hypothetical protein